MSLALSFVHPFLKQDIKTEIMLKLKLLPLKKKKIKVNKNGGNQNLTNIINNDTNENISISINHYNKLLQIKSKYESLLKDNAE